MLILNNLIFVEMINVIYKVIYLVLYNFLLKVLLYIHDHDDVDLYSFASFIIGYFYYFFIYYYSIIQL